MRMRMSREQDWRRSRFAWASRPVSPCSTQMGGGDKVEYGAMGDSLNTAARLQAKADPGGVLVGPETFRLISGRFECGDARELELKGKADRVPAYPVVSELEGSGNGAGPQRHRGAAGGPGA